MGIQENVNRQVVSDLAAMPNASQARIVEIEGNSIRGAIKEWWNNLRIGDGHFMGMMRLGGHELTQALAAFPTSNIRPMDEPGVFGNSTPQLVTEQITGHQDFTSVPQSNHFEVNSNDELASYESSLQQSAARHRDDSRAYER